MIKIKVTCYWIRETAVLVPQIPDPRGFWKKIWDRILGQEGPKVTRYEFTGELEIDTNTCLVSNLVVGLVLKTDLAQEILVTDVEYFPIISVKSLKPHFRPIAKDGIESFVIHSSVQLESEKQSQSYTQKQPSKVVMAHTDQEGKLGPRGQVGVPGTPGPSGKYISGIDPIYDEKQDVSVSSVANPIDVFDELYNERPSDEELASVMVQNGNITLKECADVILKKRTLTEVLESKKKQ